MTDHAIDATTADEGRRTAPWVRVLIMLVALSAGAGLSYVITGSTLPTNPKDALLFQNGLLLVVLGSALIEYKFTKPADSVVNSIAGMMTLLGVYYLSPTTAWWAVFGYCAAVFVAGTVCVAVSSGPQMKPWQRRIANLTYRPAVFFGRARLLFSVLFLFALFAFRSLQSKETMFLVVFWGLFVVIWPLGVPELLSSLRVAGSRSLQPTARIARMDSPNLVRAELTGDACWETGRLALFQQASGEQVLVMPLYSQSQDETVLGTGICIRPARMRHPRLTPGFFYDAPCEESLTDEELAQALGIEGGTRLVGFVVEDSEIAAIRFETWDVDAVHEGMIVFTSIGGQRIYYQVTNGATREESLRTHRHGIQIATAAQLGSTDDVRGFTKHLWLPPMNAAVFALPKDAAANLCQTVESDFVYGMIPGTQIRVSGNVAEAIDHHIALLGVTGSGKTEMAFDLIRHAVRQGAKVLCIDLTARYAARLADLRPETLSLPAATSQELGQLLFDAETGAYGGGNEKRVLKTFTDRLRGDITQSVSAFLASDDSSLGLLTLGEIANSKATLALTELYLNTILNQARERGRASKRILIVLEEAHTVVPEPSTMGLGDFDSRGVVAKIAQIALQGRKYGVGLLIVAQRTATVSKSILTQCNTVISFSCIDDTSLGFLANVFGNAYTALIPNLPALHGIVFGKGLRSDRPLIFQVQYSDEKRRLADAADGRDQPARAPVAAYADPGESPATGGAQVT